MNSKRVIKNIYGKPEKKSKDQQEPVGSFKRQQDDKKQKEKWIHITKKVNIIKN